MNNEIEYKANEVAVRQNVYRLMRKATTNQKEINAENRIRKANGEELLPTYFTNELKKIKQRIVVVGHPIRDMNITELKSLQRQLIYLLNLKSSRLETIENTDKYYKPLQDVLNKTTQDTRDKFWTMFSRLGEYGELADRFKYEIWQSFTENFKNKNISVEEFEEAVQKLWHDMNKNRADISENAFGISFTSELHKLFE